MEQDCICANGIMRNLDICESAFITGNIYRILSNIQSEEDEVIFREGLAYFWQTIFCMYCAYDHSMAL